MFTRFLNAGKKLFDFYVFKSFRLLYFYMTWKSSKLYSKLNFYETTITSTVS